MHARVGVWLSVGVYTESTREWIWACTSLIHFNLFHVQVSLLCNLIKAFHTGMMACVVEDGSKSEMFAVNNGVKQGCVLAPTLFSILFSVVLNDAFKNIREGV